MLIGLDFDNTIVCYDRLFHRLAVERGFVPAQMTASKAGIRDYLRAVGREDDWTELQGLAYGSRIIDAEPFAGIREFLVRCRLCGVRTAIVSHKTRWPYRGPSHDLHAAAHAFLEAHGFYESRTGLSPDCVHFETTLATKLARIGALNCDAFIDDLPEVLTEPAFPRGVQRVLFDPAGHTLPDNRFERVSSWAECGDRFLAPVEVSA